MGGDEEMNEGNLLVAVSLFGAFLNMLGSPRLAVISYSVWFVGNLGWVWHFRLIDEHAMALFGCYAILAAVGICKWAKKVQEMEAANRARD